MKTPEMDEDGYPTEATLKALREWDDGDAVGALAFMAAAWKYEDFVTNELRPHEALVVGLDDGQRVWRFATGGWSGNESLIEAFGENMLWYFCWRLSARGGLHIFALPL